MIDEVDGFQIVGEVDDGAAALDLVHQLKPLVIIADIEMPKLDGLNLTRRIGQTKLECSVIVLTMHKSEEMFNEAITAGAKGYVLKETAHREIVQCIHAVVEGRRFISPSISDYLFSRSERVVGLKKQKPGLESLTPAERLILKLISQDKTTKEIAAELGVSPHTITNHRANICVKVQIQGTHSLLKFAFQNKGLL